MPRERAFRQLLSQLADPGPRVRANAVDKINDFRPEARRPYHNGGPRGQAIRRASRRSVTAVVNRAARHVRPRPAAKRTAQRTAEFACYDARPWQVPLTTPYQYPPTRRV